MPKPKLKPIDPLAAANADPDSVTEIVLFPLQMRNAGFEWNAVPEFPRAILACRNLKKLVLYRCFSGRDYAIPDDLDRLTALEELQIGGLMITKLPDAIGRLSNLRSLEITYNALLEELPASIGGLTALEELDLTSTGITALPASIGKLTRLKSLTLSGKPSVVPPELFDLTSLVALDVGNVATLSPGLGRLQKLEGLTIDTTALASAHSEIPKLTRLKRLRMGAGGAPMPAEVFGLEGLESLSMCSIGLETLPSLAALKRLESLDVSANSLTSLAALIAELPALTTLSYGQNPLPPAEKRLVEALMKLPPRERPAAFAAPVRALRSTKRRRRSSRSERAARSPSSSASIRAGPASGR